MGKIKRKFTFNRTYISYALICLSAFFLSHSVLAWLRATEAWSTLVGIEFSILAAIFQYEASKKDAALQQAETTRRDEFHRDIEEVNLRIEKITESFAASLKETRKDIDAEIEQLVRDRDHIDNDLKSRLEIVHIYLNAHINEDYHASYRSIHHEVLTKLAHLDASFTALSQLAQMQHLLKDLKNEVNSLKS